MSSFGKILFSGEKISKSFKRKKYIFKDVAFKLENGQILGIRGRNGAGKSTLLKILAGLLSPSGGHIFYEYEEKDLDSEKRIKQMGFSGPYLNLYEEFDLNELLHIYSDLKGLQAYEHQMNKLIEMSGLKEHENKQIKDYSSGMKQRVKIILSFLGSPPLVMLDEPGSNLDTQGFDFVNKCINEHVGSGGALVLASNDEKELELCETIIDLDK